MVVRAWWSTLGLLRRRSSKVMVSWLFSAEGGRVMVGRRWKVMEGKVVETWELGDVWGGGAGFGRRRGDEDVY
ncbi:hypothetical protein ACOSQ4_027893 [Xanthoceras sorbifolium]